MEHDLRRDSHLVKMERWRDFRFLSPKWEMCIISPYFHGSGVIVKDCKSQRQKMTTGKECLGTIRQMCMWTHSSCDLLHGSRANTSQTKISGQREMLDMNPHPNPVFEIGNCCERESQFSLRMMSLTTWPCASGRAYSQGYISCTN